MALIMLTDTHIDDPAAENARLDHYLAELAAGRSEALEPLYHAVSSAVHSFALSILKHSHDAEDVLQDCFLKIYAGASSYYSAGKPMAWILTITKNLCMQKLRERQRQADLPQEDWEPWLMSNEGLSQEDRVVIRQCMEQLGDEERQIVTLHAVTGLRHREIAELLDLPLSTVLSKYSRAVKKLKQFL